jgi:hypothetical protein
MKKLIFTFILTSAALLSFAQKQLLSYEDIRYLLHNNLAKADTFLVAKGYTVQNAKAGKKSIKYVLQLPDNTRNEIELRLDGRKIFISIETNSISQYDLIKTSIASFKINSEAGPDTEAFQIKNLGNIYIIATDTQPYNPLKRDYDIQVVPDKNITVVN